LKHICSDGIFIAPQRGQSNDVIKNFPFGEVRSLGRVERFRGARKGPHVANSLIHLAGKPKTGSRKISLISASFDVRTVDRFRLRRTALPQENTQHHHRAHCQKLALPVLQRLEPEFRRAQSRCRNKRGVRLSTPRSEWFESVLFFRPGACRTMKSRNLLADDRILRSFVYVDLGPMRVVLRHIRIREDCFYRTLRHACIAIYASVGIDVKTIG
jgi:hypothetical protein